MELGLYWPASSLGLEREGWNGSAQLVTANIRREIKLITCLTTPPSPIHLLKCGITPLPPKHSNFAKIDHSHAIYHRKVALPTADVAMIRLGGMSLVWHSSVVSVVSGNDGD